MKSSPGSKQIRVIHSSWGFRKNTVFPYRNSTYQTPLLRLNYPASQYRP